MARKIEVVDYDPRWAKQFKAESKEIRKILGKNCVAVHHIGSTSVKGLKAKPIIDMMAVVKNISLVDGEHEAFEKLGYECMGEYGIPGRRFFRKGGDQRTHHIHIFEKGNEQDIERHLAVRDYLAAHPETAKEYGELKDALAQQFPFDNDGYCDGKDAYMKKLEQDALKWSRKQSHIGTCMSIGMCMGMAVGCSLGMIFSSQSVGMCLGMSVGMCIGLAVGYASDKNAEAGADAEADEVKQDTQGKK